MPNRQEVVQDIRKTVGGAICDPEDLLKSVLDDNDFVTVGKLDMAWYLDQSPAILTFWWYH